MGFLDPGVNLEKEQKMLNKHSPYEWIKAEFKYTYNNISYWTTHFRIAEKGIVFYQATQSGADLRIPWKDITDVGWNDVNVHFGYIPGLIIDISDGTTIHATFDIGWTGRKNMIHWLRGVSRIIQSNMNDNVENLDG